MLLLVSYRLKFSPGQVSTVHTHILSLPFSFSPSANGYQTDFIRRGSSCIPLSRRISSSIGHIVEAMYCILLIRQLIFISLLMDFSQFGDPSETRSRLAWPSGLLVWQNPRLYSQDRFLRVSDPELARISARGMSKYSVECFELVADDTRNWQGSLMPDRVRISIEKASCPNSELSTKNFLGCGLFCAEKQHRLTLHSPQSSQKPSSST